MLARFFLSPEISLSHNIARLHDIDVALQHHPSDLKRAGSTRDAQGQMHVLFYQENRYTPPVDVPDHLSQLLDNYRCQAQRRLIHAEQRGLAMSPRPMATICCSPPLSVPACCFALSLRRGKSS